MYEPGPGYYRVASKPARGGADADDCRASPAASSRGGTTSARITKTGGCTRTPGPVMRWWNEHEGFTWSSCTPVATVGLVWSQRNTDFFGRDDPGRRVDAPYTGFMHALIRKRIPYVPVHIDDIGRGCTPAVARLSCQISAAMTDLAGPRRFVAFVQQGGSIVPIGGRPAGASEWGDPRPDFALADLFKARVGSAAPETSATQAARFRQAGRAFAPSPSGHLPAADCGDAAPGGRGGAGRRAGAGARDAGGTGAAGRAGGAVAGPAGLFTVAELTLLGRTPHLRAFQAEGEADYAAARRALVAAECRSWPRDGSASCRAASGSGSPWRGHWRRSRPSSCWMSRPPTLIRASGRRSWRRCCA